MSNACSQITRDVGALVAAVLMTLCFAAPVEAGPSDYGIAAYSSGDYATAAQLLQPLAAQGYADAQNVLGIMFENGRGVPQDYAEALNWYRMAANQGSAAAQYNLAGMYQGGKGVEQNYVEAVKWYRRAADQGLAGGQLLLGTMYKFGMVVPKDAVRAYMWFNLASAQGLQGAEEARDEVARQMTATQIAEAQNLSREWRPKPER